MSQNKVIAFYKKTFFFLSKISHQNGYLQSLERHIRHPIFHPYVIDNQIIKKREFLKKFYNYCSFVINGTNVY